MADQNRHTIRIDLDQLPQSGCLGIDASTSTGEPTPVFVIRRQQHIHAYRNRCPHLGIALEWMPHQFLDREGHYIQCATHGALFRVDSGECISGPCLGDFLQTVPFAIEGNSLIIQLPDVVSPDQAGHA